MLMYSLYTPLFRLFLPCMSLAREIVKRRYALQLPIKEAPHAGLFYDCDSGPADAGSVLQGFTQVGAADMRGTVQVGQGTRHFQHPVCRP